VVARKDDDRVAHHAEPDQFVEQAAEVRVDAVAGAEIVGVLVPPVAAGVDQVRRWLEVAEVPRRADRPLVAVVVVLVVRLQVGQEQEPGTLPVAAAQIFQRPVGQRVDPVAALRKIAALHVPVEHMAVVAVRGELQHIRGQPEISVPAAALRRHGSDAEVIRPVLRPGRREVPLADVAGLIASVCQVVRDRALGQGQHAVVDMDAGLGRITARLQARPRRPAHRLAGEGIFEADALAGHFIQLRRHGQRLAVAPAGIPPLLVCQDEEDVRG